MKKNNKTIKIIIFFCLIFFIVVNGFVKISYAEYAAPGSDTNSITSYISSGKGVTVSGDTIKIDSKIDKIKVDIIDAGAEGNSPQLKAVIDFHKSTENKWVFSKSDYNRMKELYNSISINDKTSEDVKNIKKILKYGMNVFDGVYKEENMLKYSESQIKEYTSEYGYLGLNNNIIDTWYNKVKDKDNMFSILGDVVTQLSDEEKKQFSAEEIAKYIKKYKDNLSNESQDVKDKWEQTLINSGNKDYQDELEILNPDSEEQITEIYRQPERNSEDSNAEESLDDMVEDADEFVQTGEIKYNETDLQNFSKTFYNIAVIIGVFGAVITGSILGIRLMFASAYEKADAKKMLIPYVVGCIVLFGGFGIWKIVVSILEGI